MSFWESLGKFSDALGFAVIFCGCIYLWCLFCVKVLKIRGLTLQGAAGGCIGLGLLMLLPYIFELFLSPFF